MDAKNQSSPRLKHLELQGYKTFASKTPFVFAPTITAIVGPNGSGKSNIADAIRWVLGEQSYSLLRGKRTEDMIFSGSEQRPRAGMASATIAFDNSDGWLPIEFTEVTISRRAYRDGQNEYYLNGQRVRLRDVLGLLANCGLAQRTYTIIGQGLIDRALSLKADERRQLFEEAAGIGLYRSRREEALRRLENTRRNLERAQDILTELRPRLRSLERQAKRSDAYEQLRKDLKAALQTYYGYHWYHLLDRVKAAREIAEERTQLCDELQHERTAAEKALATTRKQIDNLRTKLHTLSQQVTRLYAEREMQSKNLAVAQERLRWLGDQEALIQSEKASLEQARSTLVERLSHVQEEGEHAHRELVEAEAARQELLHSSPVDRIQRDEILDRVQVARKDLEDLVAEEAAWAEKKAQLKERLTDLENRRAEIQLEVDEAKKDATKAREEAEALQATLEEAIEAREAGEKNETELSEQLKEIEAERALQTASISDLQLECTSLEVRLQTLRERSEQVQSFLDQLSNAVQEGQLTGLIGRLGEHLKFSPKHQKAIIAALGDFNEAFAFQALDDLLVALEWLADSGMDGRAALLPLTVLRSVPTLEPPSDSDCMGVASRLVSSSAEYQPAIELLLGRTLVVKNHATARRLLDGLPLDARLVTLEGDIYYPTGQVLLGGSGQEVKIEEAEQRVKRALDKALDALHAAEVEAKRLKGRIEATRATLEENHQALVDAREAELEIRLRFEQSEVRALAAEQRSVQILAQLEDIDQEIIQRKGDLKRLEGRGETFQVSHGQLEEELQATVAMLESVEPSLEMTRLEARLEVARRAADEMDSRMEDLEERIKDLEADLNEWEDRISSNQTEQEQMRGEVRVGEKGMRVIERKLADLSAQIEPTEGELSEAEIALGALESKVSQTREMLQKDERDRVQAQIDVARREEELAGLRRRVEDDFGMVAFNDYPNMPDHEQLPLEGFVEKLPRVDEIPLEFEGQVNSLRGQLRRMGAINPEAQQEYREVKQRTDFLKEQVDDLRKAESQLQEVIAELDLLMEREFRKTYDAVAVAFREAFTRLFGGGSAHLVLTEPNDLSQTGIDIEARLPGRREQGLAVLSGGERSLVACALIFALLRVSPPPFCVLDEVDAMLDDVNVIRYIEMLRELSRNTQFILITHNRLTVQAAEIVYGVSLEADSVSRIISLKLDQAEEMIPA